MAYTILNHPLEIKSSPFCEQLLEETKTTKTPNFATPSPTTHTYLSNHRSFLVLEHCIPFLSDPLQFFSPVFTIRFLWKEKSAKREVGKGKRKRKALSLKSAGYCTLPHIFFSSYFLLLKYFFRSLLRMVLSLYEKEFLEKKYASRKYPFLLT